MAGTLGACCKDVNWVMFQGKVSLCDITIFRKNPVAGTNFCNCNILHEI